MNKICSVKKITILSTVLLITVSPRCLYGRVVLTLKGVGTKAMVCTPMNSKNVVPCCQAFFKCFKMLLRKKRLVEKCYAKEKPFLVGVNVPTAVDSKRQVRSEGLVEKRRAFREP
jgi:hypothetical protein